MSNHHLLLAMVLFQQGLFGALWAAAAWLGLSRRASRHWAASTGLAALGTALILLRSPSLPSWITVGLANVALVLSFVAMRRGIQIFGRKPPTDREQALLLGPTLLGLAASLAQAGAVQLVLVLTSAVLAWTLLRAAQEVLATLSEELGLSAVRWCALPIGVIGALFALRGLVVAVLGPGTLGGALEADAFNLVMAFLALVFGLLINMMLIAMTVLRLVRRLQYQSEHDVLTRLLNRRAMQRALEAQAQGQSRSAGHYAILSLDIDHFKPINDRYGHASGDLVLARVAQALRAASRDVDRVARMGGEEFCVLLPGVDRAGAEAVAQRLLDVVRELRYPEIDAALQVTVSIGLAIAGPGSEPLPVLMRRLDQALYAAKESGRDRWRDAAPPSPPPPCSPPPPPSLPSPPSAPRAERVQEPAQAI